MFDTPASNKKCVWWVAWSMPDRTLKKSDGRTLCSFCTVSAVSFSLFPSEVFDGKKKRPLSEAQRAASADGPALL